jgi:hypothetical protein
VLFVEPSKEVCVGIWRYAAMTMTLSVVSVRFEYACGHTALVSLPRVKAEGPGQRNERINQEKAAARQRACDFCPPVSQPIAVHSNNVVDVGTVAVGPAPTSSMLGRIDNALLDHADTGDRLHDQEPEEAMILTTTESAEAPDLAPATTPVLVLPTGVFPARKLSDEQELELTRLYSETPTPLGEIGRRFGIALTSVARIAQRHGAARRNPTISRSMVSDTPVATAAGTNQAIESETQPTLPQPAEQPTVAPTQGPKSVPARRRTVPVAHGPSAETPVGAQAVNSVPVATTKRRLPTADVASLTGLRQFVVKFTAEQTLEAASVLHALQQAQARGATEVTSIVRVA